MSEFICDSKDDFFFYEIQSDIQAVVVLCYWFVFLTVELLFLIQTYRLFSYVTGITESTIFRLIYILLHLSFITGLLYLPGGLICYNFYFYEILGQLIGFFRNEALLLLLFHMLRTAAVSKETAFQKTMQIILIATAFIYLIIFVAVLYFMFSQFTYVYNTYLNIARTGLFAFYIILVSLRQYKVLKAIDSKDAQNTRFKWIVITTLLVGIYIFWIYKTLFIYDIVKNGDTSIYPALVFIATRTIIDLIPCVLLILLTNLRKVPENEEKMHRGDSFMETLNKINKINID